MTIEKVLTRRWFADRKSYDLVYEWEDQLAEQLNVSLGFCPAFEVSNSTKSWQRILFTCFDFLSRPFLTHKLALNFEMNPAFRRSKTINRGNVIPWIIDFYIREPKELRLFYERFNQHPIVLISSKEVYDFLIEQHCPLRITHLPLSISDKLRITPDTTFKKEFDVMLMGRQNPVLLSWLEQYRQTKKMTVVSCKREKGHFNYYTSDGTFVGNADSRDGCIALLKKTKIALYSTVGLDEDSRSKRSHGFSQVTPRFLEYISTGNHIIARYADNSDVDYYEMSRICPNIETYNQFEEQLDKALSEPVDMKLYSEYLEKHYMSERIKQLKNIAI